ncbi:flagellar hook-basal body complex protein FliE [Clostridium cylindrosporum]|uniref:Flagellar hook-basal body complex protein FliE n=1 Tax=Clostridium cylindrosporum DSM 605 TaxID=1121307 RepID=A0A0J8DBN1_CLOCY|nr:flagellar hook-basal body complex protein FliE [Clostridium cylindrosporum]KMT21698.1 flagellar hook-basal body complex protein FliE [Clostridium cylindrosporum DSM 605]
MKIDAISTLNTLGLDNSIIDKTKRSSETKSFGDFLKESLDKVNDKQINSNEITQKAIIGEVSNVHDVLVAAEEAKLSLELTVQVRNKIVEAYQEINRMQL